MVRVVWIAVLEGIGKVDWDMVEQVSTFGDIDQLQADADSQKAHFSAGDFEGQASIKIFASGFHGTYGTV
jgi:hypothetical protein